MNQNERLLRLDEVMQVVGFKKNSIFEGMKNGTFPAAYKITKRLNGWRLSDVESWIQSRPIRNIGQQSQGL